MKLLQSLSFLASVSFWIEWIDVIPRPLILFILDSSYCCFLVRSLLKIENPVYSLILTLLMATSADVLTSYYSSGTVALLTDYYLAPIHIIIWLLFNFSPSDCVFKVAKSVSLLFPFISGFNSGREATLAIDISQKIYNFWVYQIVFAVLFSSVKFILISFYGTLINQKVRSPGPVFFGYTLATLFYYWITDYGTLFKSFVLHRETAKLITILLTAFLSLLRNYISDEFYSKLFTKFEHIVGSFIPYYGKTWIPSK